MAGRGRKVMNCGAGLAGATVMEVMRVIEVM